MASPDIRDGFELQNASRLAAKAKAPIGGPGGFQIFTSTVAPTFAAPKGSLCVDVAAAKLYICTVAAGTWVVVGTQT